MITEETAKKNIGAFVWLANTRCEIVSVEVFGGTAHYGIVPTSYNGEPPITGWHWKGWIPCVLCGQPEI